MRLSQINPIASRGVMLLWSFLFLLFFTTQAQAQWVLKQYHVEKMKKSESDYPDEHGNIFRGTFGLDNDRGGPMVIKETFTPMYGIRGVGTYAYVSLDGGQSPRPGGAGEYSLTVTPEFEWVGEGQPTPEFFYRELYRAELYRTHYSNTQSYSLPAEGGHGNPCKAYHGHHIQYQQNNKWNIQLSDNNHTNPHQGVYRSPNLQFDMCSTYKVNKAKASGRKAYGTTRSFSGRVSAGGALLGEGLYANIGINYEAEILEFSFNLQTAHPVATMADTPTFKHHIAEADRAWKGTAIDAPIEMFYNGKAEYSVTGDTLLSTLVNPRFSWHVHNYGGRSSNNVVAPWDIFGEPPLPPAPNPAPTPDPQVVKESTVEPSSPIKKFNHDVGVKSGKEWQWHQTTITTVKIEGDDATQPTIKAQGTVDWYPGPQTRFKTEMEVDVINLDTGEVTPLADIGGSAADSEEADIDAYIKEIDAKKDETFETGKALVKAALETQMIVGSWHVPDAISEGATGEINLLTGLPLVGKLAKAVQVAKVLGKAVSVAEKLGPKSLRMVQRVRPNGRWALRTRVKAIKEGKPHAPPPGIKNADDEADGVINRKDCWNGVYCFVAGTLVSTPNGAIAIEKLQKGDLVWAKDEASGKVEAKRITATIDKVAPATLVLTFANGERIETTADHPFYVEGEGFQVAASLGIGTSIVTRAGPSVAITGIEKHESPHTVYNLTVEDFSTYFVGKSELWVHNSNCPIYGAALTEANKFLNLAEYKTPKCAASIKSPDGAPYTGSSRNVHSNPWTIDPIVNNLYNDPAIVPKRSKFIHAKCAEAKILSDLAGQGVTLTKDSLVGWSSLAINSNHHDDIGFGKKKKACPSCYSVLSYLGITDLAR